MTERGDLDGDWVDGDVPTGVGWMGVGGGHWFSHGRSPGSQRLEDP